jgi:hypothetical protein
MKAFEKLQDAAPGPEWTTDKIVELARDIIEEVGDLTDGAIYGLTMLAMHHDGQSSEVNDRLLTIREEHWRGEGKPVPQNEGTIYI